MGTVRLMKYSMSGTLLVVVALCLAAAAFAAPTGKLFNVTHAEDQVTGEKLDVERDQDPFQVAVPKSVIPEEGSVTHSLELNQKKSMPMLEKIAKWVWEHVWPYRNVLQLRAWK